MLEADVAAGNVVSIRNGKINRTHYEKKLGRWRGGLAVFDQIFTEFELRLNIKTGPTRHLPKMRVYLEDSIKSGHLSVIGGKVNRTAFATRFGLPTNGFLNRYVEILSLLEEFDARIEREGYIPAPKLDKAESPLEIALRSSLEADAAAGTVVCVRNSKISRKHYEEKLGCWRGGLTAFGSVFAEFELRLDIKTGPTRHLPKMRVWLEESYATGELGIRNGKIDRSAFAKHFGLPGGTYINRYPEIRSLLEQFDARVERDNYLPAAQREELERLRQALAAGPALNKDRVTINATALSSAAQVPQCRFRDQYFAAAIATAQAEITSSVKDSKVDVYFHNRVFWFSGLTQVWGCNFIEKVALRFKQVISSFSKESSKQIYLSLFKALNWIGSSEFTHCQIVRLEAQRSGRITEAAQWEDALFAYRDHLVCGSSGGLATETSVHASITCLRTALEALVSGRVVPQTASPLSGLKNVKRRAGHLRSLAEAPVVGGVELDYITFARSHFDTARNALEVDIEPEASEPFFASIGYELQAFPKLPDDPATAVKMVLQHRIETLRKHAVAIVEEAELLYERGRRLIEISNIDCEIFTSSYLDPSLNRYQKNLLIRKTFPIGGTTDEHAEMGLANLLALIDRTRSGIPPSAGKPDPVFGQFFHKRYLEYGGLASIEPMLIPDPQVIAAVLTLYLLESGANVSVGRTLKRKCSEKSDLEGYRRITGHKARAKGKPIIVDLPEESSSVRAIDWLLSAGRRLPKLVKSAGTPQSDEDRLFLMRMHGRVQLMTPHRYTNWFKEFVSNIPELATLHLTPNMIRPSILLHASLSNDGRLTTGMAWGQHTQGVSQGYQQKWPTRLRYDQLMRQFLASFESLVMKNVPEAAEKLGITPEQFEVRLGNLQATGLGTFCSDSRGRSGAENGQCSTIDCWNDCPNLLIVAEVEAIASLQLWQTALQQARPEMERDQPERWDRVWLPWLCLTNVVEERMARGMIKIWNLAKKHAQTISTQPGYVPPKPW